MQGDCWSVFAKCERLCCHVGDEALETEDVEHAGEVVAERHQAPFAANLVEAANQEMAVSGAAFEGPKGMLDNAGTAAHQLARALHPRAMTFENIFVFPTSDGPSRCLRGETTCF